MCRIPFDSTEDVPGCAVDVPGCAVDVPFQLSVSFRWKIFENIVSICEKQQTRLL